jgi:hypothetical protein
MSMAELGDHAANAPADAPAHPARRIADCTAGPVGSRCRDMMLPLAPDRKREVRLRTAQPRSSDECEIRLPSSP